MLVTYNITNIVSYNDDPFVFVHHNDSVWCGFTVQHKQQTLPTSIYSPSPHQQLHHCNHHGSHLPTLLKFLFLCCQIERAEEAAADGLGPINHRQGQQHNSNYSTRMQVCQMKVGEENEEWMCSPIVVHTTEYNTNNRQLTVEFWKWKVQMWMWSNNRAQSMVHWQTIQIDNKTQTD